MYKAFPASRKNTSVLYFSRTVLHASTTKYIGVCYAITPGEMVWTDPRPQKVGLRHFQWYPPPPFKGVKVALGTVLQLPPPFPCSGAKVGFGNFQWPRPPFTLSYKKRKWTLVQKLGLEYVLMRAPLQIELGLRSKSWTGNGEQILDQKFSVTETPSMNRTLAMKQMFDSEILSESWTSRI